LLARIKRCFVREVSQTPASAHSRNFPFNLASNRGLPSRILSNPLVKLLTHRCTIACAANYKFTAIGSLISVALSTGSRPPGFPRRSVLRCPDFPHSTSQARLSDYFIDYIIARKYKSRILPLSSWYASINPVLTSSNWYARINPGVPTCVAPQKPHSPIMRGTFKAII